MANQNPYNTGIAQQLHQAGVPPAQSDAIGRWLAKAIGASGTESRTITSDQANNSDFQNKYGGKGQDGLMGRLGKDGVSGNWGQNGLNGEGQDGTDGEAGQSPTTEEVAQMIQDILCQLGLCVEGGGGTGGGGGSLCSTITQCSAFKDLLKRLRELEFQAQQGLRCKNGRDPCSVVDQFTKCLQWMTGGKGCFDPAVKNLPTTIVKLNDRVKALEAQLANTVDCD